MDKNFGYTGQILRVNLSTSRIGIEPTDPYVLQALGGRGLGQAILFDELDPSVDPLGPDNKIILSAGPLVGTLAPGASRLSVDFKNVQTGGVGSANVGGHLARVIGIGRLVPIMPSKDGTHPLVNRPRLF